MKTKNEIKRVYGTLATVSVELPPENEEQKRKDDEMNKSLAGIGVRVVRAATDWGYMQAGLKDPKRTDQQLLRSGDLVKLFKTVADGDIRWQGTIEFEGSEYRTQSQKGVDIKEWGTMFFAGLPAKLERPDGTVIHGGLEGFFEQGMESIAWSVCEYGQNSYGALNMLENGDKLTVYDRVTNGEIDWQGRLSFAPENPQKLILDERSGWSHEVMRETNHLSTKDWLLLSWQKRPFIMERSKPALKLVK